jgi:hypothetical protein
MKTIQTKTSNRETEIRDLGDNVWASATDEIFWYDGISWLDENDEEWVEV